MKKLKKWSQINGLFAQDIHKLLQICIYINLIILHSMHNIQDMYLYH